MACLVASLLVSSVMLATTSVSAFDLRSLQQFDSAPSAANGTAAAPAAAPAAPAAAEPAGDEVEPAMAAPAGAPAGAPASAADAAAEVGSGEEEAQPYNQGVDECIYGNHPATLTEAAAANADFSTLVAALNASGLINAFDDISQKVTVFAPTNAAFDALFAATNTTAEQILGQTDFLQKVLKYHVVGDVMPYADLTDGATMPTLLEGASLGASTATSDSTVYSFGFPVGTTQTTAVTILGEASNATVVQGNVWTCQGVIQVIDAVLLPSAAISGSSK